MDSNIDNGCEFSMFSLFQYPQLFRGILSPWKGLLLYGPPGRLVLLDVIVKIGEGLI